MGFSLALIHLANFVLPAAGMALLLPTLVRLLWWRQLKGVGWALMARRVALVGVVVLAGGLIALGRDGAMATYAALTVASAVTVWWTAFKGRA